MKEIEDRYELAKKATAHFLGWDEFYDEQKKEELKGNWTFKKRKMYASLIIIMLFTFILLGLLINLILTVIG